MNFAHLHVHTEYSLLDGSNKIKEYVARVKDLGMNSAATVSYTHLIRIDDTPIHKAIREAVVNMICLLYTSRCV